MWDEITYPFLNFNGATVEVYEWISNFTPMLPGARPTNDISFDFEIRQKFGVL